MEDSKFPNVTIQRIDSEGSIKGTEDAPVMEEFIDNLADLAPERLEEIFEGEETLVYTLIVNGATERGAVKRGKAAVRAKNPFSTSRIDTITTDEKSGSDLLKTYTVTLGVKK